jgi:predicted esterase
MMSSQFLSTLVASVTLPIILAATTVAAQTPEFQTATAPRLTVRPHAIATGTHTDSAGLTELKGFAGYYLYVPSSCVGTQRCPLILLLPGGGRTGSMEIHKFSPLADKYGMIVLAATALQPGRWDVLDGARSGTTHYTKTTSGIQVTQFQERDVRTLDSALKQVLASDAIDPDRIALVGFSDGGSYSLFLGRSNQDIFSRVAALSALIPFAGSGGPVVPTTQFVLSGGIAEKMVQQTLKMSQVLRHEGHPVVTLLGLRAHVDRVEDEDFVWDWLKRSWADPSITLHPPLPADADPLLTVTVLQKMTTFWGRFVHEPDSVFEAGRLAHQEQLWMSLGDQPASVITTDIPALAAAFPSVAADLQAAGLTAEQEQAYRTAILRVGFARAGGIAPGDSNLKETIVGSDMPFAPIPPNSVLAENLAFRAAHDAEFKALSRTGMWTTQ